MFTHSMMVETTLYFMKKHINICWPFPPLVMYSALMVDQEASRKLSVHLVKPWHANTV